MENYVTISDKEKIEDFDVAEIVDYIERHFSSIKLVSRKVDGRYDYFFKVDEVIDILFMYHRVEVYINDNLIFKSNIELLKNEKVGILGYFKKLKK